MNMCNRILLLCLFSLISPVVYSGDILNTEDFVSGAISISHMTASSSATKEEIKKVKKEERSNQRTEKFRTKLEKIFQSKKATRTLGNISDPVDKWFWIWTISWGVGFLITLSAGAAIAASAIGIIWLVAFTVGAASLIVWLIKKFR